jgi:hypothetical protein
MNDTKALDEERLRADEARSQEVLDETCSCCGVELTKEELKYDEGTCFPCQKGNCEICREEDEL